MTSQGVQDEPRRLFVVDDDPDIREQFRLQLEAAGYEVEEAASEAEALKRLEEGLRPDAAILDLMMEHDDGGFVLAHRIKRLAPQTPVLLVTGVASVTGLDFDRRSPEERAWIKADAILAKPVRFEQLKRELDRLLPR